MRGAEEAGAVVFATLGSAQERQAAHLLAAGALDAARREGRTGNVAQLGELDGAGRANARLLAQHITGSDQQRELFEAPATAEQRIAVRLDRVGLEGARWFGRVWLGWKLWRRAQTGGTVCRADA
jgi:hypothetical protein